ncbi:MAG: response regulator [Deltaproteobacteria bacterium]|nr:response regulator [Deltaproteobacteria bacterium]
MTDPQILKGKRILVVDDEADVIEVARDQLEGAEVVGAETFGQGKKLIEEDRFDLAILDIMGVNGFELLKICSERQQPAAMLTARSINVESVNQALKHGAVSFLPKDELASLSAMVPEILEGLEQGKSHWGRLFQRLGPLFKEKWGIVWEELDKPDRPKIPYT